MARRSSFSPLVVASILDVLRAGGDVRDASRKAKVSHATIYAWLDRGSAGEAGYAEFREAYSDALAVGIKARHAQLLESLGIKPNTAA